MCPYITITKKKKRYFNFYFPKYKLFLREIQDNIVPSPLQELFQKLMFYLNSINCPTLWMYLAYSEVIL